MAEEIQKNTRKKNQTVDITNAIYGKLPPMAKELESSVLGIMMMVQKSCLDVMDILQPTDFYLQENQKICEAIFYVGKVGPVDELLVIERLRSMEDLDFVGGAYGVIKLTKEVTSGSNLIRHCRIIKQKSIQRKLIEVSAEIIKECYEDSGDALEILSEAESKIKEINFELTETRVTNTETVASEIIEKFEKKGHNGRNNIIDPNAVYTGMPEWDKLNGPLFNGLYVVAGRPAMGKGVHLTELACRMGAKYDIGIINGEMTNQQLLTRIGCNLMNIDNFLFKKEAQFITKADEAKVREAMEAATQLKLHIENSLMIEKIITRIKLWVEKFKVKCILADFLTLFRVSPDKERYLSEKQVIDYILREFAECAKKTGVPIILYVQMNRLVLGRAGAKEPNMGDLKGSGSIEELAYQISMLHRPEYYDPTDNMDEDGESTKGLMYQNIIKHREGENLKIKYNAVLSCSQLRPWGAPIMSEDLLKDDLPF